MIDTCIYDPYDQCCHECPNCPRYEPTDEPDIDFIRDMMNERE